MSNLNILKVLRKLRIVTESTESKSDINSQNHKAIANSASFKRSLQLRHVDAGSCNGCEIEISGIFSPIYDGERFGTRLVASPRHADSLLVTGVVTINMEGPLLKTLEATPKPRIVIAVGDCACNCGIFKDAYGVVGAVSDVVEVDFSVPGCPPTPSDILNVLRQVTGR